MSDRPDELKDDLLARRLRTAMGDPPPRLSFQLERLARAKPRRDAPDAVRTWLWFTVLPRSLGPALLLGMTAGALALSSQGPNDGAHIASSMAWPALMLPFCVALGIEAMRGAPTIRRWLAGRH